MPPKKTIPSPNSNSSSDDETEFVPIDDVPIVKTITNLKGRLAGLAKGRAISAANKNAVRKVKEVTQTINKAQRLQEKATTTLNEGRMKAKEVGLNVPEASPYENQLQQMLNDMRNEIKELKTIAETKKAPEPEPMPEPLPEPTPKTKTIRKKATPKPKPEPEPENEFVSPIAPSPLDKHRGRGIDIYQERQNIYIARAEAKANEEINRMEILRQMMGRK